MIQGYSLRKFLTCLAPVAALLAVAGCQHDSVPRPEPETDYFPLEVGRYRTYAVLDTLWANYRPTISSFQFRETITAQITDATGQPAYRVVRARRVLPTDTWRDDSVMVLTPVRETVVLTRNNRRTVELVFPVRKDRFWNMNAFNSLDSVVAENRYYQTVGEPFQARSGGKTFSYEQTLTTALAEDNRNGANNAVFRTTYEQVYAKGVGPVFRARRRFTYCADQDDKCFRTNTRIYRGRPG
ncbi:hypothetical protein [Hymenobacter cellulosilyticus]|uniref:Lipoprotein n=1 Tax=Hymenobacter cellulosilyticus TaxID=2932248 RepID=A0A8T9Q328_9BACT|nr:hypothetical protein [Hymenobacter cellulosilyticus]UOQ70861.1 hypothetical protein MUN79_19550 [Hymenobacter cellulosilyticus]